MGKGENSYFRVTGGTPLSGTIRPQGNKNEALPLLAACLLTDQTVTLKNLPGIEDVYMMQKILQHLGAQVQRVKQDDPTVVEITAARTPLSDLPQEMTGSIRGSVTLAGPLLARTGRVFLPKPGGDRIGRRRLDTHIQALEALGAKVKIFPDGYELQAAKLQGTDLLLEEASVTATENAVSAAVLAEGETVIHNAASEPHVQQLCRMLNAMGAKISGIGSNILKIQGVKELQGTTHRIGSDYLEVGSFVSLAAVTGGELFIEDVNPDDVRMMRLIFSRLGIETRLTDGGLRVPGDQSLDIVMDLGGAIPKIDDGPWPGFPADMTSVALVTATQCNGTILIHEKMFESRLYFTDLLLTMGARIVLCDPHRAVVMGPTQLNGGKVTSPDIRAGMAMLIAALAASGQSEIHNIQQIDRGFHRIDDRLKTLGAQIERISE